MERILTAQTFSNLGRVTGGIVTLVAGDRYSSQTPVVIKGGKGEIRAHGAIIAAPIVFQDCKELTVRGATFDGERRSRGAAWDKPTVRIQNSTDWKLEDCRFKDARGDHLYIAEGSAQGFVVDTTFIGGWRNGISVINGRYLTFQNITVHDVNGVEPMAGIDIEANADDFPGCNHDIAIVNSRFSACGGRTILGTNHLNPPLRVTVRDNTLLGPVTLLGNEHWVQDNRVDCQHREQIGIGVRGNDSRVTGNDLANGKQFAVLVSGFRPTVSGNTTRDFEHPGALGEPIRVEPL
jgi:hypothetical protein